MKKITTTAALIAMVGVSGLNAATGSGKVGVLNFALTDTYQHFVLLNGAQAQETACSFADCSETVKYQTSTVKVDNKWIISSIAKYLGVSFTAKAQLAIVNYDNDIPDPAYPPYLACENDDTAPDTFNAPWDVDLSGGTPADGFMLTGDWPNALQIDWVDYSQAASDSAYNPNPSWLWNKATVHISDPSNPTLTLRCVDVSPFFSFEEAFCYFCWDTVDRVTTGSALTTSASASEICIGGGGCGFKGSGTTKYYFTIKFNAVDRENKYLAVNFPDAAQNGNQNTIDEHSFTVSGIVNYPWKFTKKSGVSGAFGTMTMSQANGYGREPYCGVLAGSVRITETTDAQVPLPCVVFQ